MKVSLKKILKAAQKGRYAVPAFNFSNLEILQAVVAAAKKLKSPIIIQTSEGAIKYAGMKNLVNMACLAAKEKIPVAFHLDHGKDLKIIKKAIESGYASVMFDGSNLPYKENLKLTRQVVKMAHPKGVSVEAELGAIRGIEDLVSVSEQEAILTNPKQAQEFVLKSGCDALAVSVGTSHGAYKFKGRPKLDIKRLKQIKKLVKVPLVLHGASGVPKGLLRQIIKCGGSIQGARGNAPAEIKKAIKAGISKINIDTDLRLAFTAGVRCALKKDRKMIDPRKILQDAKMLMEKTAEEKIRLCNSQNKAK